jgi:hypothetical protein
MKKLILLLLTAMVAVLAFTQKSTFVSKTFLDSTNVNCKTFLIVLQKLKNSPYLSLNK